MRFKRKIIILVTALMAVLIIFCCFQLFPVMVTLYSHFIFYPYQWLRGLLFGFLPFSIGDLLCCTAALWAVMTIAKWLKFLFHFKRDKLPLAASLLNAGTTLLLVYLLFFLGWGGNYYKASLGAYWGLDSLRPLNKMLAKDEQKKLETNELEAFDSFLVDRLNVYAPHFRTVPAKELNTRACRYYRLYTDTRLKKFGLGVKPSLLSWLLNTVELDGYYNPFTGEGQFQPELPSYSLPELFTHEIAHQAGIAAEGDANLLSYAVCTASGDSSFCYSAYLNAWQLADQRLSLADPALAGKFEQKINLVTRAHIDSLEKLYKDADNGFSRYFDKLFDGFLKSQGQAEGVDDYANIAATAWQLEQKRAKGMTGLISIP